MDIPDPNYKPSNVPGSGAPIRQLMWDDKSHFVVLTQLYGSVWPQVLPFCLVNCFITFVIYSLKHRHIIDLTSDPSGHKYMAIMMVRFFAFVFF